MLQPRTAVQLGVCLGDLGPYNALQDLKKHLKGMVKRGSHAVEHLESYPESPHSLPQALFDEAYSSDDPPLTHQEAEELSQKHGSSSSRVPLRSSSKLVNHKSHASPSSGSLVSSQQGSCASGMSELAMAAKALQVFSTMKRLMDGEPGDDENVLENLQIFKKRKSFGSAGTTSLPIQDTPKEPEKTVETKQETQVKQTKDDGVDEVPEVTPDLVQKALEQRKLDQPKPKPKAKAKAKCKAKAKAQVKAKVAPKPKASAKTQGKGRPAEPAVGSGTIYYGRGKIQTNNADAYRVFLCVGDRCDRKIKRSPDAWGRILSAIDRGHW